jgi:ribose 5-phosphate isomerase A
LIAWDAMNDPLELGKRRAAMSAAALVEPGMVVGLGSGSTAALIVSALGDRMAREGLSFVGVPTSGATHELALEVGIRLIGLNDVPSLDLVLDGADEVDPLFRMIKGRGGAFLREKMVAASGRRRVIVITPEKRVDRLGLKNRVPIEVSEFALRPIENAIRGLGGEPELRREEDGTTITRTDEGHRILDCRFIGISGPEELDAQLKRIPGVFETGLFVGLCDQLLIGSDAGAQLLDRPMGPEV